MYTIRIRISCSLEYILYGTINVHKYINEMNKKMNKTCEISNSKLQTRSKIFQNIP